MNSMPSCVRVARRRRAARASAIVCGALTRASVSAANALSSSDTAILQRFFDLGQRRHGVRAKEPRSHDCPGDVAVLDDAYRLPPRQQTVHEHPAERVTGTQPADHLDEMRRNDGG